VLRALQRAERRMRTNRLCRDAVVGITALLLLATCLKSLQLVFLLRGATVYIPLAFCCAALAGYLGWKFRSPEQLTRVAAAIDRRASLHDEIKSAYWFITNPDTSQHRSEWMNAQIGRAAEEIRQMDLQQLFPRPVPDTLYAAPGLIALIIGLSFIPLPGHHHWFNLQDADAQGIGAESFARRTEAMLNEAQRRGDKRTKYQIEGVVARLERDEISQEEALQALDELSDTSNAENPDAAAIEQAIDKIASSLEKSESMKEVSEAMRGQRLLEAADKMRDLADRLGAMSPDQLATMSKDLRRASDVRSKALASLLQSFKQAAAGLRNGDIPGVKRSIEKSAEDLRAIDDKLQEYRLLDPLSVKLVNLANDLRKFASEGLEQDEEGEGEGGDSEEQQGNRGGKEQRESSRSRVDGAGAPSDKSILRSDALMPSGMSHPPLEHQGIATALDVQLQKEMVPVQPRSGKRLDDSRAVSRAGSSRLSYQSVQAQPGNAAKEILGRDSIPRAYRPLIRDYFQAIRSREKQ